MFLVFIYILTLPPALFLYILARFLIFRLYWGYFFFYFFFINSGFILAGFYFLHCLYILLHLVSGISEDDFFSLFYVILIWGLYKDYCFLFSLYFFFLLAWLNSCWFFVGFIFYFKFILAGYLFFIYFFYTIYLKNLFPGISERRFLGNFFYFILEISDF